MMLLLIGVRWVHICASVLLASIFVFKLVIVGPPLKGSPGLPTLLPEFILRLLYNFAWKIWIVEIVSSLLWLWAISASMTGVGFVAALSPEIWSTVLFGTQFGHVWIIRSTIGLILGSSLWLIAARRLRMSYPEILPAALAMAQLVSLAWTGHAAADVGPYGSVHLANDAAHLAVAAFWPGGLVPLAALLLPLLKSKQAALSRTTAQVIRRFSISSLIAVAILWLTGLINSFFLVGSIQALLTGTYGQILLCKVVLFLSMVGFGAWNLFVLKPKLAIDIPAKNFTCQEPATHSLLRNVLWEIGFGTVIIMIVAILGITPPTMR
jgi:copper resistance protein D